MAISTKRSQQSGFVFSRFLLSAFFSVQIQLVPSLPANCALSQQSPPLLSSDNATKSAAGENAVSGDTGQEQAAAANAQAKPAGLADDSAPGPTTAAPIQYPTLRAIKAARRVQVRKLPLPTVPHLTDPYSTSVSPNAVQLIEILRLSPKLEHLHHLQEEAKKYDSQKLPIELRQNLTETKVEIMEVIEQSRLDIDFVVAEIEQEQALMEELLQAYTSQRDDRVNRANIAAFRTNGVLWAVAEALDIPTYSHPRYSISSGSIGILAGLVPSVFSLYAVRATSGTHNPRDPYLNMLNKIYDFPSAPQIQYPESVWRYLNSPQPGDSTKTRRQLLIEHWAEDRNIKIFANGVTTDKLRLLTGIKQSNVDIDLLTDRLTMLKEVKALSLQMTRPLLEINMIMRDEKHLPTFN